MTQAHLQNWYRRAQRESFALGAFNVNTLEYAQAIVAAAQAEKAPAILQVSHRALAYMGAGNSLRGLRYFAAFAQVAAQSVDAPIILHLDHGTYNEVLVAVSLGFNSVMFDGGDLPYEQNIACTRELHQIAHDLGVCLEAELGETPKAGGSASEAQGELTDPQSVAEFVARTGVEALAISIGSAHGGRSKTISLDLERLAAIQANCPIPLVLHGSSGVQDADIQAGIALGLRKINVATQMNMAFSAAVRAILEQRTAEIDPRQYLGPAREQIKARVQERLRCFGAAGKAV